MAGKQDQEKILNYNLRNLDINEICPNIIDGVVLSIEENKRRMDLPLNMSSEGFHKWIKGRGGVFSKDITSFLKGKMTGIYILMEGEGERTIIRLIDEEELPDFESKKLINGKVKDKAYMIFKSLKEGEPLISTYSKYVEETISDVILESEILNMPHDEDSLSQSIQLFAD